MGFFDPNPSTRYLGIRFDLSDIEATKISDNRYRIHRLNDKRISTKPTTLYHLKNNRVDHPQQQVAL